MGNSSTTLLFLAVSTILNIFLDLALVLAVPLGVLGVALGTVIAQLCSWLFGIWYINRRYPQLAIHPFNGIFDRKLFCEIIRIGLPSGIQMSLVALGAMGVLSKVNSYGKAFTAGFNVGNKLDTLSFLPVQSLAAAVISFVGQNMGASREDRVRQGVRITVTMAVVWTVLSSALVVWLSVPLSRIFSPDPAVRGRQPVSHGERGGLCDPAAGPLPVPAGKPLRPGRYVLELRHRLGRGLRSVGLSLCCRKMAGKVPQRIKTAEIGNIFDRMID